MRWCERWWTCSGRPYIHYDIEIPKWQMLGDYDVFLAEFFQALVLNAGLTAHLDLVRGDNPHHIVEATFKAFARALDAATSSIRGWRACRPPRGRCDDRGGGLWGEQPEERGPRARGRRPRGALTADPDEVRAADRVLVPGVGNFGQGTRTSPPPAWARRSAGGGRPGRPVMGSAWVSSCCSRPARRRRSARASGSSPAECGFVTTLHVPHVGWAQVDLTEWDEVHPMLGPLFAGEPVLLPRAQLPPQRSSPRVGTGNTGRPFPPSWGRGPVIGAQFHPEKSQRAGIELLDAFALGPMTSVRVSLVDVYVLRRDGAGLRCLVLRRAPGGRCPGSWETVHGHIEEGEHPADAAARELQEETGLVPERLYNLSRVETFYQHRKDEVALVPVFVAFVPPETRCGSARSTTRTSG